MEAVSSPPHRVCPPARVDEPPKRKMAHQRPKKDAHPDVASKATERGPIADAPMPPSSTLNNDAAGKALPDLENTSSAGIICGLEGSSHTEAINLSNWDDAEAFFSDLPKVFSSRWNKSGDVSIVYQDIDGDWMLFQPSEPWQLLVCAATQLLLSSRSFVMGS
uniref:PB1 domain-containing protein n=1 Tax=Tetraselmis chuii TaxID=63592 RepID=A0A7S1SMQ1_9CHLO